MSSRGYPPDWSRRRAEQLARQPWCEGIIPGRGLCGRRATTADHRINRRLLVARRHPDPDGPWNLQSLCSSCHSRKTAHETGFARRAQRPRFAVAR